MVRKKARRSTAPSHRPVPVTVLHGFLGSGKTTLLQSLLAQAWSRQPRLHVAVVVNDLSELDVDGVLLEETDVVGPQDATLVSITGGSIHSAELLPALERACATVLAARRPDHLFLETSGSTRPGPVVDFLRRHPGLELHGLLTLVDAAMLRDDLDLGRGVLTGLRRHLAAGTQGVESLLAEQLMVATDVYLSKVDKLTAEQVQQVAAAIHPLNPRAGVTAVRYGNLGLDTVLAQPRYDHHRVDLLGPESASRDVARPQATQIASYVLDDPRPFHPQRLWDAYTRAMPQELYRSKGFTWLPTRDDQVLVWNQAAGGIGLEVLGYWKAGILGHADSTLLPEEVAGLQAVVDQGDPVFGDRRTQLTLLGPQGPTRAFLDLLRTCLCTDEEVRAWQAGEPFDDPWPTRRATLAAPGGGTPSRTTPSGRAPSHTTPRGGTPGG